jgi:hypothetical protein
MKFNGDKLLMKQRGWGFSPGGSQPVGNFGAVHAMVCLSTQALSVAQVHGKGPPATGSGKVESSRSPQAGHRVSCP